jgi:hypothetical protein
MDQSIGLSTGDRRRAVETLSRFVASAVELGRAGDAPFYHLVFDRVFPDDVYNAMLAAMPVEADYRPMSGRSKSHDLTDGTHTRVKIDLFPEYIRSLPPEKRAVWDVVGRALCSETVKRAFVQRLAPGLRRRFGADFAKVGMYPIPSSRATSRLQDSAASRYALEGITVQLYLPRDDATSHIGTIFHERLPDGSMPKRAQMKFLPNTGYAFAVAEDTWHSADTVGPEVKTRDSILLTYFVDQGLLRFCVIAASGVGNFLGNEIRYRLRR